MSQITEATLAQKLEALLFLSGEELSYKKLMSTLKISLEELTLAKTALQTTLAERASALALVDSGKALRLVVGSACQELGETLVGAELETNLTKAALEVLAIVVYRAPIARADIDSLRGVNSQYTLRNLLLRGLIDRSGNPHDARGYVYTPSMNFLTTLGMKSTSELPDFLTLSQDPRLQVLGETAAEEESEAVTQEATKETT